MVCVFLMAIAGCIGVGTFADDKNDLDLPPTKPPSVIVPLDKNRAKIGKTLVDANRGEVSFPGKIISNDWPLEVFVSSPNGRSYEGLIVTEAEPIDVETGLRLLGLEGGGGKPPANPATVRGDPVEIFIEWKDPTTGKIKRHRAEEMMFDAKTKKTIPPTQWIHTGSRWSGNRFMGQACGDIIVVERFPDAMIEPAASLFEGTTELQPNRDLVPPRGTDVTVFIRNAKGNQPTKNQTAAPAEKPRRATAEKKGLR